MARHAAHFDTSEETAPEGRRTDAQTSSREERHRRHERKRRRERRASVVRTALLMLVALVVGAGVGMFVRPAAPSIPGPVQTPGTEVSLAGRTSVSEEELDAPLGTYTYGGVTTTVTVREGIEEQGSLESARNEDGSYAIPSADAVLSLARNRLLLADAQARGIEATDEDALAYAQEVWGTQDLMVLGASYDMDEERTLERLRESATISLLRDQVVTTQSMDQPKAPEAPEEGKEDEPTATYASYVLGLVGDEWDADADSWAREDGPYYDQLKNFTIGKDAATYSAAQAAYGVAQNLHAAAEQQRAAEWTAYVNQILAETTVELGTLVA